MESLIASSSRRLLRPSRNLKRFYTGQPTYGKYTVSTICSACRVQAQNFNPPTTAPRRWISQMAAGPAPTGASPAATMTTSSTQSSPEAQSKLHAPRPPTHYDLFPKTLASGPPPSGPFVINLQQLRREYLQLQATAHPDRHSTGVKAWADATSARINEAYKTLRDPLLRTQYLLLLRGIDVAGDEAGQVADGELLGQVFEAWEVIDGAEEEGELLGLKRLNEGRIGGSEAVLERAFGEDDLLTAREEAVRLRYWVNIRESLHAWEKGKSVDLIH